MLLDGLTYPWTVIADHAAVALVALDIREAVPRVLSLLDHTDPCDPYQMPGSAGVHSVREGNGAYQSPAQLPDVPCPVVLDRRQGARLCPPPTDQPLPPSFTQEYYAPRQKGLFVRADITYLQQDFSTPLTVPNHGQMAGSAAF